MDSTAISARASPEFLAVFRRHADADGAMPFARFMELALYDREVGYYASGRTRIGYRAGTDFFTSSSSGPVFGEMVAAACVELLGDDPAAYTFVEIGAETAAGVLANVPHRFAATRTISLGAPIALAGKCVVFSNELFDAQPFNRYVFRRGGWRELGVALKGDALTEIEMSGGAPPPDFPREAPDGYVIDAPFAAARLAERIAAQRWTGLFVGADYGKSWREIVEAAPAGTARAYYRHTQSNDLLARPGQQDLTCHVCWDWLAQAVQRQGFTSVAVESQEAFFIRHAGRFIEATSIAEASRLSQRKLALFQLLHPSYLGQKFQVLHGRR